MSLPDPIYLGKILLLQSTLHIIPENQIPAFVSRGLSSLPGLKSLSILLQKNYYAENKDVLLMEEDCRKLLYKTLEQKSPGSTENNSHIHRFEEKNQVKCLKIETSKELYGLLFLQITEKKVFQDYIPYVENTSNLIALVIENNLQKKMLTDKKAQLEKTVRERTIQLESTVNHLHSEIAERKKKEESLKTSEQRFLTVLDSIDATVYVADMDTYEILFMNQHMIERFGQDMTGKVCWSVFRAEAGPCMHCTNDRLIDENGNPTGVHVWDDKNPVTGKWYINYDRAIEWMDGRLVRLQIATDVTEFKHMEEKLRQTQKMEHHKVYSRRV